MVLFLFSTSGNVCLFLLLYMFYSPTGTDFTDLGGPRRCVPSRKDKTTPLTYLYDPMPARSHSLSTKHKLYTYFMISFHLHFIIHCTCSYICKLSKRYWKLSSLTGYELCVRDATGHCTTLHMRILTQPTKLHATRKSLIFLECQTFCLL